MTHNNSRRVDVGPTTAERYSGNTLPTCGVGPTMTARRATAPTCAAGEQYVYRTDGTVSFLGDDGVTSQLTPRQSLLAHLISEQHRRHTKPPPRRDTTTRKLHRVTPDLATSPHGCEALRLTLGAPGRGPFPASIGTACRVPQHRRTCPVTLYTIQK